MKRNRPHHSYYLSVPVLFRMLKFNISCPRVQLLKKHCLVMSFIGHDRIPAPKLKDAKMSSEDMEDAYDQVKKVMSMVSSCEVECLPCNYKVPSLIPRSGCQLWDFHWPTYWHEYWCSSQEAELTLSSICTHFNTLKKKAFGKHCGKR